MEVLGTSYMPGDPRLVEQLVHELKSQGIFDQFRKECIADVDTKPAYQNLRQRVEGSVTTFLSQQTWRPDMIKNQLREQLRKNIHESGYLEAGVERIVEQVVNPKINTVILPQVEDVAYRFLGIEKPYRDPTKQELNITISDLLPKDLEAVSPDSVHSFKYDEKMRDSENMNDSLNSNSKADEDESPPFELLIEASHKNESLPLEDNSVDSHLSGFSGLQSHESNHDCDSRIPQTDLSNLESQVSQNDSSNRSSIIISNEVMKMDICEDSLSLNGKIEADELKLNMMNVDNHENNDGYRIDVNMNNDASDSTKVGDNNFSQKEMIKEFKKKEKKSATGERYEKNNDDISSKGSNKHVSGEKKDKYNKSSHSKDLSKSSKDKYKKDSKSSTSSTKDKDKKDKYKEKTSKSDKYSKEKSSKDKEKTKVTVDRKREGNINEKAEKESDSSVKSKEKDKPENTHEHDKDREKNRSDKMYDQEKSDKERDKLNKTHDKEKSDKEKKLDKTYYDKERSDKDKRKSDHSNDRSDKGKADPDRSKEKNKDNEKTPRDSEKSKSKENSEKNRERDMMSSAKSREKCEKDQGKPTEGDEKLKEKSDKENASKEKDKHRDKDKSSKGKSTKSSEKSRKEKEIDRERSKSSSSKHKSSSSSKKESTTSSDAKKSQSSTSSVKEQSKNVENDSSKSLDPMKNQKKEGERKHDPKKQSKDDHYSSKEKKNIRRSTDRDSNDGNSSRNNSTNSSSEASSSRREKNDNESSSSSGPVDSGNSDAVESCAAPVENNETITDEIIPLKLTKPKFASNIQEARKLMKIRKEIVKLEQINSSCAESITEFSGTVNMQDISDSPLDSVKKSVQPLKLTKPKFASNFQEAVNLMKIRKQLADLEKQNQLKLSTEAEKCDQDTVMESVVADNYVQQVELTAETTAATSTIKPFKLNKPKFALNFQEARKLMKIRKQLAKLERLNQQKIAAKVVKNVSNNIKSGESADISEIMPKNVESVVRPLKLNKPKFASNFREATKLMKIRKQLSKLEQENKLGFTEVPGNTGNGMYKADKKNNCIAENESDTTFVHKNNGEQSKTNHSGNNNENPDPSMNEPLKSTELSQENWEALEARLAQEMSGVNYNCYDESYEYENSESSALNSSSKKCEMRKTTIRDVEVSQGELISEDSQNDSMEFKGFKLDDNEKNPTNFFKKFLGEQSSCSQDSKISDFTVSKTNIDKPKTIEGDKRVNKFHNNFKELSVMLGVNDLKNINASAVRGKGNIYSPNECRYLEQQSPSVLQNLQYVHKSIEKLEKKIEYCKIELQNNIHCRKGQKRKFQECVDVKNNNKAHFEQTTVKKRGRPPGSNSAMTKAAKMCNISDVIPNNSFPLPLSPAESDKSNDKKEEDIMVPAKQRRIARASQRYASEDLYKPRLVICRRSRGAKNSS